MLELEFTSTEKSVNSLCSPGCTCMYKNLWNIYATGWSRGKKLTEKIDNQGGSREFLNLMSKKNSQKIENINLILYISKHKNYFIFYVW